MGFEINEESETTKWVEAKEGLWLTSDRERLVAADDPEAAFLFASAGKRISVEDAERFGLVKSRAKQGDKQRVPEDNKAAAKKPAAAKAKVAADDDNQEAK